MEVITKALKIDETLVNLIKKYKKYRIATAWASLGSKASVELLKNKDRIKMMVVGTHFYQTHPNFVKEFIDSKKVNFIFNPSGVYHPKVYLFSNSKKEWECIIGSANFTTSALSKNSEVVVHIRNSDIGSKNIYKSLVETIEEYWENAEPMNMEEYQNYNNIWEKNRKKINGLKEKYGNSKNPKSLIKSDIFALRWSEFFEKIQKDKFHSFAGRIELLNTAQQYFRDNEHFSVINEIQRREIAGIATKNQTKTSIDWGWFGSMSGAGRFQNRINENNPFISQALDTIPLDGNIYKSDYDHFISQFKKAFPNGGAGIAIASRLLAMKRPDCFVCLDKQNLTKLCAEFGIPKTVTFESYWENIIERIHNSVWYLSERPINEDELDAWSGRVAMLDSIFYIEKT